MTSVPSAAPSAPTPGTAVPDELICCRKALSSIAVTTRGTSLTLHSCTACGRHVWAKDGVVADREDLLDGVKVFLEQPREVVRRRSPRRAAAPDTPAR
jgi:hypothetical protein